MLGSAILLGAWLSPAPPASPRVRLEWTAPPRCPDRAAVLEAIDRTLGQIDEAELREVDVRGSLEVGEPEGFVLHLTLDDGHSGARELRAGSCEELSEAAALVIAMAIDPRLLERIQPEVPHSNESERDASARIVPEPEPEPEPAPEPEPESSPTAEPELEPSVPPQTPVDSASTPESRDLAFVGRFDGGVGGGPLPGPGGVLTVGAGLAGRRWRAELTASYWPPTSTESSADPTIGVRAQLWTLGVQGCGEPRVGPVSFPLCGGLGAGAMHAVGTGDQQRRRVASRWVALVVEPGVVWWTRPRLGLALRASGHAALARPQWRSEPSGVVVEAGLVGGTLRAGLELRLP